MGISARQNARWHEEPKDQVHSTLVTVFNTVYDEESWRVDADEFHAGLYRQSERGGVRGESMRNCEYEAATLPYGVCRSAVDTLTAKIAKQRPLPQVLTNRGEWKNQRRARKMTQYLEGEFYRQRLYEKHGKTIVRDALTFGRAALKIFVDGQDTIVERAHVWELFVDRWDARYGNPRNLYHCRSMDREVAIARFARTESGGVSRAIKDAIESAGPIDISGRHWDSQASTVDRVDIIEAWHLPSRKGAKDGRHVVVVQGATLLDEPWTRDTFPFAFLNYSDPLQGFWGYGLVEQLEGYQYEINLASEKSSEQHRMSGVAVICADGSGIYDSNFRNGINIMRRKAGGQDPVVFDMDLVNEHTRARPRELTQDALNDAGLSQMSVQSQKPEGITSGIALQTLDDVETERFMIFGRAYEAWNLDVARQLIECAKEISETYGDLAVSVPMRDGLLELKWSDVVVEGAEIKIYNTSALPEQKAARLEALKDLFNTGQLDGMTFLRLIENPDLIAEIDLTTADRLLTDEIIEAMLDADEKDGEKAYIPPNAYMDLQWAAKRAQQKLNRAQLGRASEFILQLLRDFIEDCERMDAQVQAKKAAMAAPPPPPMPGAGGPPPAATPQAPLLPDLGIPGGAPPMAA